MPRQNRISRKTVFLMAENAATCVQLDQQLRTMCEEQENRRENTVGQHLVITTLELVSL